MIHKKWLEDFSSLPLLIQTFRVKQLLSSLAQFPSPHLSENHYQPSFTPNTILLYGQQ